MFCSPLATPVTAPLLLLTIFTSLLNTDSAPTSCDVILHNGCTYGVTIHSVDPVCDTPHSPATTTRIEPRGDREQLTTDRELDNFERTLIKVIDNLSLRTLRMIRRLKAEVRQVSESLAQLSKSVNVQSDGVTASNDVSTRKSNSISRCPKQFVSGGVWPSCYRFVTTKSSWIDAQEQCGTLGARLVALDSMKEAYIVDYLLNSRPDYAKVPSWWTSGRYMARSQRWMWTSGVVVKPGQPGHSTGHVKPIVQPRWSPGEPNGRSTQHCLLLSRADLYAWTDGTCTDKHAFICEADIVTQ